MKTGERREEDVEEQRASKSLMTTLFLSSSVFFFCLFLSSRETQTHPGLEARHLVPVREKKMGKKSRRKTESRR